MATPTANAISILNALVDGTSTAAQRQRAVAAFGSPEAFLAELRRFTKQRILSSERRAARQALPPVEDPGL